TNRPKRFLNHQSRSSPKRGTSVPLPPEGVTGCGGLLCAAKDGAEESKDGAVVSAAAAVPRNERRFIVVRGPFAGLRKRYRKMGKFGSHSRYTMWSRSGFSGEAEAIGGWLNHSLQISMIRSVHRAFAMSGRVGSVVSHSKRNAF